jgi:hypothetical protein
MSRTWSRLLLPAVLVATLALCASPPAAQAFDATKPICALAGLVSGLAGKVCSAARHAGTVLKAGQKLLGGHLGGAVETLSGSSTSAKALTAAAAFGAAAVWVIGGAKVVLHETAAVISATSRPQLQSTWFSSSYWRMAGISALLTLPFLFAAAIQALLRSDLALLARSALGYLPLGVLAVSIAAPLTQLLLAASDELSALVSSASGYTEAGFTHATALGIGVGALSSFPVFFVGLLAVAATMTLWVELLIRAAAVYVIVLMLPLFFAALVWPARRIWAMRAVELLLALILSKFAIVAVLALGGAALGHTTVPSVTQMLAGTTLIMLAAFTPWALLRLLPLHELASSVEGMRGGGSRGLAQADAGANSAYERSERDEADLPAARVESARGDVAQTSAARSTLEGLRVGPGRGAPDVAVDDEMGGAPAGAVDGVAPTGEVDGDGDAATTVAANGPGPAEVYRPPDESAPSDGNGSALRGHSERLPGLAAPWQSANFTWSPVELDPDALPDGPVAPAPDSPGLLSDLGSGADLDPSPGIDGDPREAARGSDGEDTPPR